MTLPTPPPRPPDWDSSLDLLILLGNGSGTLARQERAAGQKRVFVVSPERDADLPEEIPWVSSPGELLFSIVATHGAKPNKAVVHSTQDPWANEDRRAATLLTVQEGVRSRQAQHNTLDRNGATWMSQGLENLASLAHFPAITQLFGKFTGRTAFVCAPGPSLSEAMPHLREHRSSCLIIAVSHALHSLVASGIYPDIVMAADPGNLERHFAGIDTRDVGAMVIAATSRASLFDVPARSHFHFAGNGQIDDWLYRPIDVNAHIPTGGSVSCSAATLALKLGCRRLVFSGLDLSFPDGRFYSKESLDGDARVHQKDGSFFLRKEAGAEGSSYELPDGGLRFSLDQRVEMVPSVRGGMVPSSLALCIYKNWFEGMAERLKSEAVFVQTSRKGALIQGFEHNTIEEEIALISHDKIHFESCAAEASAEHDAPASAEALRAHFSEVAASLPMVEGLSRKLSQLASQVCDDEGLLPEFQEAEAALRSALTSLQILTIATHGDMVKAEEEARRGVTLADNLRASRRIFGAVERAARLAQPLIAKGLAGLDELAARHSLGRAA